MTATDASEYEARRDASLVPRGGAQRHPDPLVLDEVEPHRTIDDDPDLVVGQLPLSSPWRKQ